MKAIVLVPTCAVVLLALTVPVVGMLGSTPDGPLIAPPPYIAQPASMPAPAPTSVVQAKGAQALSLCNTTPNEPFLRTFCSRQ